MQLIADNICSFSVGKFLAQCAGELLTAPNGPSPHLANLLVLYHNPPRGSTHNSPPRPPSSTSTTITEYIIMSGSSGHGHQPAMHDSKDKTDMDPTTDWASCNRKPPEDKMTAKDALPASEGKGKVKRTKSTDKKSVSCSMNLHHHLAMLTFEAHLCDILGRNAVNGFDGIQRSDREIELNAAF
jgi:hypothetical protein